MTRSGSMGPDFARLWLATGVTAAGAQLAQLAMPLLAVLTLHASSAEIGLLGSAQWVPFLIIALPLGVLVDRRRRLPLLIVAEIVRAAAVLVIVVLGLADVLAMPSLVALAFVTGCGTVLFEVAYQSFLPSILPSERLDTANSRLQATEATALVGGPAVGGLLVQAVGAAPTLCLTALGSVLSAWSLSRIRPDTAPARAATSAKRALFDGVRFVWHDRVLAGLLGFSAISNLFAQWIMLLFLIDAVRRLHLTPGQLGLVLAIGALGTLLGAAASPRVSGRLGPLKTILLTSIVDPLTLFVLPLAHPGWGGLGIGAACGAALALNGVAVGTDTVVVTTIRQRRTPDPLRGRANAAYRFVSYGFIALGAGLGGAAGEWLGTRVALLVGCLGALLTIVWVLGWAVLLTRRGESLEG